MKVKINFTNSGTPLFFNNVLDTKVDGGMYGLRIIENGKRKVYLFPIATIDSVEEITNLEEGE